jgi:hypothetical protein
LPLDLLEAVPQPVVVLLDVLLEKDPGQRFRNPAELLKAIPAIIGARGGPPTMAPSTISHPVSAGGLSVARRSGRSQFWEPTSRSLAWKNALTLGSFRSNQPDNPTFFIKFRRESTKELRPCAVSENTWNPR